MIDTRRQEMLVRSRGQDVPAWSVGVRWRPVRAGHADYRPRPVGSCVLFAKCGNMAVNGVCAACATRYRRER